MPVSQFTIYTNADTFGPGLLTGQTGSLTAILDACLVNGYGSGSAYYKPAAGWSKPLPNISSSVDSLPQLACYQQGATGSQYVLFVNDSGPNITSTAKEAWVTGWENMSALTGSGNLGLVYTASNSAGSGWGQFPLPSQQLTYGHVVWRKSASADSVGRPWMIAADCNTVYLWVQTSDLAGDYMHGGFGEIFSFAQNDQFNCFIYGRATENNSLDYPSNDYTGVICNGNGYQSPIQLTQVSYSTAQPGHWLVRNWSGTAGSLGFTKKGDAENNGGFTATPVAVPMYGIFQTPNAMDNSFYVQPLQVLEPLNIMLRGRLRGLYMPMHPISNLSDGQIITAGGDYVGKTFIVIAKNGNGLGAWMLEISNTVETNS